MLSIFQSYSVKAAPYPPQALLSRGWRASAQLFYGIIYKALSQEHGRSPQLWKVQARFHLFPAWPTAVGCARSILPNDSVKHLALSGQQEQLLQKGMAFFQFSHSTGTICSCRALMAFAASFTQVTGSMPSPWVSHIHDASWGSLHHRSIWLLC